MSLCRLVTAEVMGDPAPDRLERAEALRLSLPEPRPEIPLSAWLSQEQTLSERGEPADTLANG